MWPSLLLRNTYVIQLRQKRRKKEKKKKNSHIGAGAGGGVKTGEGNSPVYVDWPSFQWLVFSLCIVVYLSVSLCASVQCLSAFLSVILPCTCLCFSLFTCPCVPVCVFDSLCSCLWASVYVCFADETQLYGRTWDKPGDKHRSNHETNMG